MQFAPAPTEPPINDSPNDPVSPPMTDPVSDPSTPPAGNHDGHDHSSHDTASQLTLVAATTDISLMTDSATGLAYVQEADGEPILITRADDYWEGDVPLTRGDATLQAAARDELGRLRVLDGGGLDVYAWILSETGHFIGEDGPTDSSITDKEELFQLDIDNDGHIGQTIETTPTDPTDSPVDPVDPPVTDPVSDPVMPPSNDHEDHDHSSHDSIAPPASSGDYVDITSWGTFHGSNNNSHHDELVGGRTAITTEAAEAYNHLRAFFGLSPLTIEEVGQWAFANELTNNTQAWGNDLQGVGLWYAMQGAKVGWIADDAFDPQILADIQRTARLGDPAEVMEMVVRFGHDGFADYLQQHGLTQTFINTLKMEPHYGGWMHGRTHGWRSIEGVAIAHDVNHLTVLSWDQMQPFMNDTFDWPQWPALDVSHSGVIEYFQSMVVLGDPGGDNLSFTQPSSRHLAQASTSAPIDAKLTFLLDSGKVAARPPTGSRTPSDHQGTPLVPLVTDGFSQPVPSNDWWSSVHFAKYGNPFSAPLHVHPLTVQLGDSGLSVGGPTKQSIVVSGPTTTELKTLYQLDLQLDLFAPGQPASSFALDSYSDWSFTGNWQGNSSLTTATLALASPMIWLSNVDLDYLRVGFNTAPAAVEVTENAVQVAIAGRNYALFAPEGISWTEGPASLTAAGTGPANIAVALLPDAQAETREHFSEAAARPVLSTRFDYSQAENPYSLQLTYEYDLGPSPNNDTTVVAFYPHLERLVGHAQGGTAGLVGDYNRDGSVDATDYVFWSDTRGKSVAPGTGADGVADGIIDHLDYEFWKTHFGATPLSPIGEAGYLSARGTMNAVPTRAISAQIPARGVLPTLPDLLNPQQRQTLAELVRADPQANDPEAYLSQWQDTYWSGKSMLKMMQLAQMADTAEEFQIRDRIVQAVQNTLGDWFSLSDVPGDRHFSYNSTWNTMQGYPDSFGSAGDLNDHHFHYGYFVHAAALVGIYDPSWVAENADFVDVLIADVANVDSSSVAFPRLRTFSPMAGHSWASGHGAFASGNNQESSSEAMNFATAVTLWGEVSGNQNTTQLGQMLYSLEAEAISQYWFDKYQTTYPDAFDVESVGMVWGDGAAHATWFSAEVEMIKAINFLPFHGGSLYLSETAHDPYALLEEITELNDGPPDVWQGLLLQYEALVDPAGALAHYAEGDFEYEEGQSAAHTYFWMTTLATLGTPTSAIRGDHALSAVFVQPGMVTYAAHNPTGEAIEVLFTDGASLQVSPFSTATITASGLASVPPTDPSANNPADPDDGPTPLEDLKDGQTLMLVGQTFQKEYTDFIDGTGLVPAGSSHYGTFYLGQIEQGDDNPNATFLDTVRDNDLGDYAMVALSFKDNTPAGGYGQMIHQGAADFNANAIWEALDDIRNGAWDPQIDRFAQTMASRPDTQFLVRVGYEVSLLLFAYNGEEPVVDWLDQQATDGVNVFENPDRVAELDPQAFIDAYNHIVDRIKPQAANVEFGYHPVRGFHDTLWLYPGKHNVDWVGFSVFNNDVCIEVSGTFNCSAENIDPNLAISMDFARAQGHEVVIAESTAQNPAASIPGQFIEYLDRLDDIVQEYDAAALVYINSNWPAHGWGPEWGDSRVEMEPAVESFFLETFGEGTRYVYAGANENPSIPPGEAPIYDNRPADELPAADPPATYPPVDTDALEIVAETTDVRLLVDTETDLAYVQEGDRNPILIRRADDYWSGDIPLSRDGATLKAAARDAMDRLRVLDVGPWGPFAWILDESGMFIGEEGPNDSTAVAKETLFGVDLNNDGSIGEATETMPSTELPSYLFTGGDVVADGVQVRLMTFNVYYASLGAPERIDGIAQAVADYAPDIASIQEMWGEKDQILAAIKAKTGLDYAFSVGSNTWDGDILYRADRWRILEDGVVTYDGSRGMSHATLEHLETGKKMSVYGMHPLAGVSEKVHLRNIEMATAHMIARRYADEAPVVLLGDMNAHKNSESMRLIRDGAITAYGQDWAAPLTFVDTFRTANGDQANGNTGFGVKIDYVYVEQRIDPVFRVEGASIRSDAPGGSDHFPVMAQVVLLG